MTSCRQALRTFVEYSRLKLVSRGGGSSVCCSFVYVENFRWCVRYTAVLDTLEQIHLRLPAKLTLEHPRHQTKCRRKQIPGTLSA